MATDSLIGNGGKFEIGNADGPPETFTAVAEVTKISPPSDQVDVIDATHLQSPDATREFIIGLRDPGECTFDINFVPGGAGDTKLQSVRAGRVPVTCRITYPPVGSSDAVTWTFTGILTSYEPDMPNDDKMTASVTFKVTGSYVTGVAA